LERSPYYYSHQQNELGADNVTIDSNKFYDGGEIADVWLYSSNEAQGTVITNNEFNPSGGRAASVYNGKTADLLIQDNTIVGGKSAISVNSASNFLFDVDFLYGSAVHTDSVFTTNNRVVLNQ
jgi:hypothetical protein